MTNREKLGNLGEDFFHVHFQYLTRSSDKYDIECDFRDDFGHTYEVKTQTRHPTLDVFSIGYHNETNRNKCLSVDHLIFIEYNHTDYITIYECIDRTMPYRYTTRNKKAMIGFPLSTMKVLRGPIHSPDVAKKMREYSSDYRFK